MPKRFLQQVGQRCTGSAMESPMSSHQFLVNKSLKCHLRCHLCAVVC